MPSYSTKILNRSRDDDAFTLRRIRSASWLMKEKKETTESTINNVVPGH